VIDVAGCSVRVLEEVRRRLGAAPGAQEPGKIASQ
jgi:hypothetical protein